MSTEKRYKILALTDHRRHSEVESTYGLFQEMGKDPRCLQLDVVTRHEPLNEAFFLGNSPEMGKVIPVDEDYTVENRTNWYQRTGHAAKATDYDVVMLRLPRPTEPAFFEMLMKLFPDPAIINHPDGIELCGSKAFLVNFQEFTPPIALCNSLADMKAFLEEYEAVFKPLVASGGIGILRAGKGKFWDGKNEISEEEFWAMAAKEVKTGYLAMKYLKNVNRGDKRVLVFNRRAIGAALRKAQPGSWISNASQGADAFPARPSPRETEMAEAISARLAQEGVIAFGFDTLVDDTGRRVLSEINASCVNGLLPAQEMSGKPVFQYASNAIWEYISAHVQ